MKGVFVLNYSNKNVTGERDFNFVHISEHNLFNQKLRRLFCYCFFHLRTTLPLHKSAGAEKKNVIPYLFLSLSESVHFMAVSNPAI